MYEKAFEPYVKRGAEAENQAYGQYQHLAENPWDMLEAIMEHYEPSKGFQLKSQKAQQAMRNTANAGGYTGTEYDKEREADLVNSLLHQDMGDYINQILGIHGTGLSGLQGLGTQGFNATQGLTGALGQGLGAQANLAYTGQQFNNQSKNDFLKELSRIFGQVGSNYTIPTQGGGGGYKPDYGGYKPSWGI